MRKFYLDLNEEVPIPDDNDPEVLAAIQRGIKSANEGPWYTRQQVEEKIAEWRTKYVTTSKS